LSIVSAPFLFLFLPAVVGVYYLIPAKKDLRFRNIFLVLAGIVFYTWGEPVIVFLLIGMIFLTWCFGKMAYKKNGTIAGKTAVFLTVITNLFVLFVFGKLELILSFLTRLSGKDFSVFMRSLPIGFAFFVFSSISYVVDIYRDRGELSGSFFKTVLYTSAFFKVLQGPIVSYRKFESQISNRQQSFDLICEGVWRISIGLCKKLIIADSLSLMVKAIMSSDFSALSFGDAWLGCISYLVYLYFDFSGYSDMAIGLGKLFGYTIPENFNYPYISTSIADFWRRFHITLCNWFTEYLYYPVLLGPSIKYRKFLLKHKVGANTAKTLQNIFVVATVWLVTALWHGLNLNYALWGVVNCVGMLIEPHIKPIKNKSLNTAIRRAGMLIFLFLSMPLISIATFKDALMFYKAMFAGALTLSDTLIPYVANYGLYLIIGIIGCFPVLPYLKKKFFLMTNDKYHGLWDVCAGILLIILVFVSIAFLFSRETVVFLYQQ